MHACMHGKKLSEGSSSDEFLGLPQSISFGITHWSPTVVLVYLQTYEFTSQA